MWACSPFSTIFLKIISAIVGGFRTVKQWISFYRPVLGPHTSCQSLGALKWPTDISLNEGLTSAAVGHRRLNTPISTRPRSPLPRHHNLPCCESPSALSEPGEELQIEPRLHGDGPTGGDGSPRLSHWAPADTQDPVFLLCSGHPMHGINAGILLKRA